MAHYVFRKGGIPALASAHVDGDSCPCLCSLVVKVNEACKQATIVLRFDLPLDGFETDQQISLVYDADCLVAGETTFSPATEEPGQLCQITRRGGNNFKSLRVVLRQLCTVLCPHSSSSIAPRPSSDNARFQQCVNLAKATRLCITFDYAWLHPDKSAQFLSLVSGSALAGFPRNSTTAGLRETDWTAFSPARLESWNLDPPAYEYASTKRPRATRTSSVSPPQTPIAKRVLLEPGPEIPQPSPTEKATTVTATLSPRLLSSSPPAGPFDLQNAVERVVAKQLPAAVQAALPGILMRLLAIPPSTSLSGPHPISPLHQLILKHLTDHADELAKQVTIDTLDHATGLRDTVDAELQEQLDDHRLEYTVIKEEGVMEMRRLCDAHLQEMEEKADDLEAYAAELVQSVEEDISLAYTAVEEKIGAQMEKLERTPGLVQREFERGQCFATPGRRARSMPLEVGR